MLDITALGEILIDFTPGGETPDGFKLFIRNPGGAPANLLAQASACGAKTAFIGKAGADEFGRYLKETLETHGVAARGLRFAPRTLTTIAFVHLGKDGAKSFSFCREPGADATLRPEEVDLRLVAKTRIFHFGTLSLTGEPCRSATVAALETARRSGALVSFDPNWRPFLWPGKDSFRAQALAVLNRVDILKVSAAEAEILTGIPDGAREAARALAALGPRAVLLSLGSQGARLLAPGIEAFCPPYPVEPLDTTGAGDAFFGAILASICLEGAGEGHLALDARPPGLWKKSLALGAAAGALACTRKGGMGAAGPFAETEKAASELLPLVISLQ
ncbi:MAG: carbohydrate kinase [Deltaproteobacteria bacterium]|jgi:fructokinase|nr:carbohydrate kinase [Deltaproteobacteria bacterium]